MYIFLIVQQKVTSVIYGPVRLDLMPAPLNQSRFEWQKSPSRPSVAATLLPSTHTPGIDVTFVRLTRASNTREITEASPCPRHTPGLSIPGNTPGQVLQTVSPGVSILPSLPGPYEESLSLSPRVSAWSLTRTSHTCGSFSSGTF